MNIADRSEAEVEKRSRVGRGNEAREWASNNERQSRERVAHAVAVRSSFVECEQETSLISRHMRASTTAVSSSKAPGPFQSPRLFVSPAVSSRSSHRPILVVCLTTRNPVQNTVLVYDMKCH